MPTVSRRNLAVTPNRAFQAETRCMKSRRHPEIDRGTSPSRSRGGPRPRTIAVAALVVAVLVAESILLLSSQPPEATIEPIPAKIAYTSHDPIYINGDAGFNNTLHPGNGVVSGDGTISNPYVIAGWDIDASAATGIAIWDVSVHFTIRDCYVHDGWAVWDGYMGINLISCTNGTVSDSIIVDSRAGINLQSSGNCVIVNNTCSSNEYIGIYVHSSQGNNITNNTCSFNSNYGIGIAISNDNILNDNHCTQNALGIDLNSANNNTLSRNDCSSNSDMGISIYSSSENALNDNDLSGNIIGVNLNSANDNIISDNNCSSSEYSGTILYLSTGNTLTCNDFSGSDTGMYLYESNENQLTDNNCSSNANYGVILQTASRNSLVNNDCSGNYQGMYLLQSSDDNNVSWNRVCHNSDMGVYIQTGSSNRFWNNTFINNNGGGVQAFDSGTGNCWNSSEGYGNYWSDWTTPDVTPADGIVDVPYDIGGSAGAKDYYPLTAAPPVPIPEFGAMPVILVLLAVIVLVAKTRRRRGL